MKREVGAAIPALNAATQCRGLENVSLGCHLSPPE